MSHPHTCRCPICVAADEKLKSLNPPRKLPKHVIHQIQEKKAKQDKLDQWRGVMEIQCPHCNHFIKVKISSRIACNKCGKLIQ